MDEALQMAREAGDPPRPSRDLLDILMQVYADAVRNGDGYLGRAQLEYTLMRHDLCLIDARDAGSGPSVSRSSCCDITASVRCSDCPRPTSSVSLQDQS